MNPAQSSVLLMAAFVILWASVEMLASSALQDYSPYQVVWTRYGVHLVFMMLVWRGPRHVTLWRTGRPVFQLARALLMLAMPVSWVMARDRGVQNAELMALFWLAPIMILGLARATLGERVGRSAWVLSAAGYAGALLCLGPHGVPGLPSLLYPIVMAFTFAAYAVMTRSLRSETTRANLFYTALGVFVPLTVVMPELWVTPTPRDAAEMILVGLLGWVTLYVLDRMAAAAPLRVSAPFAYLQLPFALGAAWLLGGRAPGALQAAGAGLVLMVAFWGWRSAGMGVGEVVT